jgi:hypothetical protein
MRDWSEPPFRRITKFDVVTVLCFSGSLNVMFTTGVGAGNWARLPGKTEVIAGGNMSVYLVVNLRT